VSPRLRRVVAVPLGVLLVAAFLAAAVVGLVAASVADAFIRAVEWTGEAAHRLSRWAYRSPSETNQRNGAGHEGGRS